MQPQPVELFKFKTRLNRMLFKELDKHEVVKKAQLIFLDIFPLQEIECKEIRVICKNYRFSNNNSVDTFLELLSPHFNYFYQWAYNNWMTNVFYVQKR